MMSNDDTPIIVKGFRISGELFTKGYPTGSSPCTCSSACCEAGVWADLAERDAILEHKELIKRHMDETQSLDDREWFDPEIEEDADFASGWTVGTRVVNDKCVFLDKSGRCSVQAAASAAGMDRWTLKPLYCVLYPIYVEDGMVGFDDLLQDEHACCSVGKSFSVPLFEACRDELTHLLGIEGFAEMQRYYEQMLEDRSQVNSHQEHR
jgi:Fe-S-cluster containining protein